MKRLASLLILPALLAACTIRGTPSQQSQDTTVQAVSSVSDSSASSAEAVSSTAESSSSTAMTTVTLVDQDYASAEGLTGMDWLKAIGTAKLTTQNTVGIAKLHIHLSSAWMAVGMYIAPSKTFTDAKSGGTFESPDESVYGTRLHFIDAVWSGDGQRHLSKDSTMGVLAQHATDFTYDLSAVPVTTGDDGKDTTSTTMDIAKLIDNGGAYIGFAPSGYAGHITATLEFDGTATVTPIK